MIRYLSQEEKGTTIPLWMEAFPEDSESFLEYYYKEKTKDNRILVAEEETRGQYISMVHRNPYKIQIKKAIWEIDYIVAVATAKKYRHQGFMKSLLVWMMEDMYQEERPFCFLMPASPKIYEPFDFVYIYDQPHWRLKDQAKKNLKRITNWEEPYISQIACWMNQWLEKRYQVFARRSLDYVERLGRELESENGWIELLTSDGSEKGIIGIQGWWGLEKKEQRMLLAEEAYIEQEKSDTPAIMARIIHLKQFLKAISLKKKDGLFREPLTVHLEVEDNICKANEGSFLWTIREDGSELCPWKEGMKAKAALKTGIGPLTGYLFGYDNQIYKEALWMEQITVLKPVFLDEVV